MFHFLHLARRLGLNNCVTQIFNKCVVTFLLQSLYDKHLGVEFQSEIRTLAQVEHLNLVKFYGYLEHEDERIVVVEYVPNGTLREHLDCEFSLRVFTFALCVYVLVRKCLSVTADNLSS